MKINEDGTIREVTEEEYALYNPEIPTISDDSGGVKLPSWKKIRTITIPSDEYKGQEIDGVLYSYSGEYGIKGITFSTDSEGNSLEDCNVKGAIIKLTPTENINVNQGFISINNGVSASIGYAIDYFTNIKATTTLRWFEISLLPFQARMITNTPGQYNFPAQYTQKQINKISIGGFEATSVLGEGTKIEVWAYGYWDE